MYRIKIVDLDTGDVEMSKTMGRIEAVKALGELNLQRRAARKSNGSYPMPVHGIIKEDA